MSIRERSVVYGAIAILVAFNLVIVLDLVPGSQAIAEPAFVEDVLGPAAGLELTGEDDPILVRNASGRLAWGDEPSDRVHSVAYVSLGALMPQLMQREEIQERREDLRAELEKEEAEWKERMGAIEARGQALDPDSDELPAVYEEWQQVQEQMRRWQQNAMARTGAVEVEYLEVVYRELVEAVNVVAERRDIDIVYQFTPTDAPFQATNPGQAMSTIRSRIALRYPDDLDITDYVVEEMGLEAE